ncbi:MAG: phytanoyl-CoA dioxygenase family protein, partial [Pseudomonadota bacterium]|nr:phytanoyl-CoA dioxygenase family protein [Pseudomonadota bacterium]
AGATLWIALDGMSEESGCLYYAAGSHRYEKDRDLEISGFDRNAPGVSPVAVEAGDAIIHHAQTVHWSGGNHTQCPRRAVAFFYYGASAPAW